MTNTTNARTDVLRSEIALSWDGGDPWGSTLSALGGICDVLYLNGAATPTSAGYVPAMGGPDVTDYPASMFAEMLEDRTTDLRSLFYFARVLSRFADLVPEDRRY